MSNDPNIGTVVLSFQHGAVRKHQTGNEISKIGIATKLLTENPTSFVNRGTSARQELTYEPLARAEVITDRRCVLLVGGLGDISSCYARDARPSEQLLRYIE